MEYDPLAPLEWLESLQEREMTDTDTTPFDSESVEVEPGYDAWAGTGPLAQVIYDLENDSESTYFGIIQSFYDAVKEFDDGDVDSEDIENVAADVLRTHVIASKGARIFWDEGESNPGWVLRTPEMDDYPIGMEGRDQFDDECYRDAVEHAVRLLAL